MEETIENRFHPLSLNRDCWLLICKQLSCKDLLSLAKVSTAFREFIHTEVLPTKYKYLSLRFYLRRNCIDEDDFKFLLNSVWSTVESVKLLQLPNKHFELLQLYHFPCATHMRVTLARFMFEHDMMALGKVFPNLRTFVASRQFFGKRAIGSFKNLEDLNLTYCKKKITLWDFRSILMALNLKSLTLSVFINVASLERIELLKLSELERLQVNCHELSWLCAYDESNPITFKNLKLLIISVDNKFDIHKNIDNFFRNMKRILRRDVYELECYNQSFSFYLFIMPEEYEFINKVQKLKYVKCIITDHEICIASRFKSLRELHFYDCHASSVEVMQAIVFKAKDIDLLSFVSCTTPLTPGRVKTWPDSCYGKNAGAINNFERRSLMPNTFDTLQIRLQ